MKKLQHIMFGLAVISLGLLSSCKEETSTNTEAQTPAPTATGDQRTEQPATAQVNPQHGLPGHRCDIPVGAPLNSEPASSQMQQTNTQTSTPSSTVSPIRLDQSPKVNPPHGQPGHDCSIPVGAELKQQ